MRSVQDKFLTAVEEIASTSALEPVHDREYGNTGTLYLHGYGGFDAKVTVAYEFRNGEATIYVSPLPTRKDGAAGTASWPYSMPRVALPADWLAFHLDYSDGISFARTLAYIRKVARKGAGWRLLRAVGAP